MTIEIPLTQGQVAIVDEIDSDLAGCKWFAHQSPNYASAASFKAGRGVNTNGKQSIEFMHRVILSRILERPLLSSELVDHIDGNPLHNWRDNLRLATHAQNAMNTGLRSDNTSGYKGVSWSKRRGMWRAAIKKGGETIFLGYFSTPEEAYEAYKKAAIKHFGKYARFE